MKVDIKLRRLFQGQDQWGMFIEEVGITQDGLLAYRATDGGNCEIGEYLEWESESEAVEFMLGFTPKSDVIIKELKAELSKMPNLKEYEEDEKINYGGY